jgi:adenine phosphoribosyltransferase
MDLRSYIRDVPNFPKPGILFKDITPLLKSPTAFREAVDALAQRYAKRDIDAIVGVDARGFLIAGPLAYRLGKPLVPVRKRGKLPFETVAVQYDLEYGTDAVEVHTDGISSGERVLVVDDLLATGGTLAATASLVEATGGRVESLAVLVELTELSGRDRLQGYDLFSLITF